MRRTITFGSASIALAATLHHDWGTTHSLFKCLVVEEEGKVPHSMPIHEELKYWGARIGSSRHWTRWSLRQVNRNPHEIALVAPGGSKTQTVNASIRSPSLREKFQVKRLTIILGLRDLIDHVDAVMQEETEDLHMKKLLARTLDSIGNESHPLRLAYAVSITRRKARSYNG